MIVVTTVDGRNPENGAPPRPVEPRKYPPRDAGCARGGPGGRGDDLLNHGEGIRDVDPIECAVNPASRIRRVQRWRPRHRPVEEDPDSVMVALGRERALTPLFFRSWLVANIVAVVWSRLSHPRWIGVHLGGDTFSVHWLPNIIVGLAFSSAIVWPWVTGLAGSPLDARRDGDLLEVRTVLGRRRLNIRPAWTVHWRIPSSIGVLVIDRRARIVVIQSPVRFGGRSRLNRLAPPRTTPSAFVTVVEYCVGVVWIAFSIAVGFAFVAAELFAAGLFE
jgi:hypothetical protein